MSCNCGEVLGPPGVARKIVIAFWENRLTMAKNAMKHAIVGTIALLSVSSAVSAGFMGGHLWSAYSGYSTSGFFRKVIHQEIPSDFTEDEGSGAGLPWVLNMTAEENNGFNDILNLVGDSHHIIAIHGEPENPNQVFFNFGINADDVGEGNYGYAQEGVTVTHPPTFHLDEFRFAFSCKVTSNWLGSDNIESYTWIVRGDHRGGPTWKWKTGTLQPEQRLIGPAVDAHGVIMTAVDPTTNLLTGEIVVNGLVPSQIQRARLHVASSGLLGPVIWDFGPGTGWIPIGSEGCGYTLPPIALNVLQSADYDAGRLYCELEVSGGGWLRAQLLSPPQTSSAVAVLPKTPMQMVGPLSAVQSGDDNRLSLIRFRPDVVAFEAFGNTTVLLPSQVEVSIQLQTNVQRNKFELEAFDRSASQWLPIATEPLPTSDRTIRVLLTSHAGRFVDPVTGQWQIRGTLFTSESDRFLKDPWRLDIDAIQLRAWK